MGRAPEVRISARYFDLKAFQGDTLAEDRRSQHYLELLMFVAFGSRQNDHHSVHNGVLRAATCVACF